MASSRPVRTVIPSSKLGPDNAGEMELTTHQKAIATAKSHPAPEPSPVVSSQSEGVTHSDASPTRSPTPIPQPTRKRKIVLSDDEDPSNTKAVSDSDRDSLEPVTVKPKTKKQKANQSMYDNNHILSSPDIPPGSVDSDVDDIGMHRDVNVQSIVDSDDNDIAKTLNMSNKTADIDHFFRPAPKIPGEKKGHLQCLSCV